MNRLPDESLQSAARPTHFARAVSLALSTILAMPIQAQGDFDKLTVDDLRPPLSPAFVLLGVEPSTVQRPSNPRALSTALLSLANEKQGIPKNFALEAAPFWLRSRPAFTFEQYYALDSSGTGATILRTIRRSSAFSLGTTPRTLQADTVGTSMALGYRVMVWPGRASKLLSDLRTRYEDSLGSCADLEPTSAIDACHGRLLKSPLRDSLKSEMEPVGWKWQVAGGVSMAFPHDTVQNGKLDRLGMWITPSYRTSQGFEFIFVARYLSARLETAASKRSGYIDGGARILWTPAAPIALSAESVSRRLRDNDRSTVVTTRYGALVEYKAAADMYVFYAFGKDFAAGKVDRNRLLSTLGFNIGYGAKPIVTMADKTR